MIEIREMKEEDLDFVIDIEKKTFSMPWSKDGFLASMKRQDCLYLSALLDGKFSGYCGMMMVLDEGEVTNVAVKKEYRGRHIGTFMLEKLLAEGVKRGAARFYLEVRQSNQTAIGLYEKTGFRQISIRKNFYDKPRENAVIMLKS